MSWKYVQYDSGKYRTTDEGGGGEENVIESISLNGVDVPPDANKNVALTVMDNTVNNLTNYYLKTETYTQAQVDASKANKTDIAYVESGNTASQAYSEGDLIYVGGVLYKVLTAISSGQSFTIGTNVTAMSVDMRLKEINTQVNMISGKHSNNITSRLNNLSMAIAEQNLEKYGYKIGDYFLGASGYQYDLADLDPFFGGYNSYAVITSHHVGIVVDTKTSSAWNETSDISNVNYKDSTLHTFLSTTVLDNIKSDLTALFGSWENHLISHDKLYNKLGDWAWSSTNTRSEYISALTECQVYGCPIQSADNYQQGEGDKQLKLFRKKKYNAIFGPTNIWLRSISTASRGCNASRYGYANTSPVTASALAAGLILFK